MLSAVMVVMRYTNKSEFECTDIFQKVNTKVTAVFSPLKVKCIIIIIITNIKDWTL
jgi:hypothetical protein